jgi:hypothetical protein
VNDSRSVAVLKNSPLYILTAPGNVIGFVAQDATLFTGSAESTFMFLAA